MRMRNLATQLRAAAAERGLRLLDGPAEAFLAKRIRDVASALGIGEDAALRQEFNDEDVATLVEVLADGATRLDAAYSDASPILLPVSQAARIIAALGQAALHANINRAANASRSSAAIENAAAAITTIAIAIERAGSGSTVIVEAAAVIQARFAMTALADNITSGAWIAGGDTADERRTRAQRISETVTRDLQLLPALDPTTD
jgi:hypothetical protein